MRATHTAILRSFEIAKQKLADAGLLYSWNESTVERLDRGRRRITWATSGTRPELMASAISNIQEFLMFLEGRHYQFQLNDGSLIQMSYDLDPRNHVTQSRLVWYPCPVEFQLEELEYASISELVSTTPTPSIFCRSPLRFDYAPDQIGDNHSCTHLHLGSEDFRLPVQRPLEPSRFIRLIIRTAYPNSWKLNESFRDSEDWGSQDRLDNDDRTYGSLTWNVNIDALP